MQGHVSSVASNRLIVIIKVHHSTSEKRHTVLGKWMAWLHRCCSCFCCCCCCSISQLNILEGHPVCAPTPVHVQVQVQSIGWADCVCDCFQLPSFVGNRIPSSEEMGVEGVSIHFSESIAPMGQSTHWFASSERNNPRFREKRPKVRGKRMLQNARSLLCFWKCEQNEWVEVVRVVGTCVIICCLNFLLQRMPIYLYHLSHFNDKSELSVKCDRWYTSERASFGEGMRVMWVKAVYCRLFKWLELYSCNICTIFDLARISKLATCGQVGRTCNICMCVRGCYLVFYSFTFVLSFFSNKCRLLSASQHKRNIEMSTVFQCFSFLHKHIFLSFSKYRLISVFPAQTHERRLMSIFSLNKHMFLSRLSVCTE